MTKRESGSPRRIGLWGVASIGIGGMVVGGIFAVLGLSVQIAGGGAPVAFLVAGLVALLRYRLFLHPWASGWCRVLLSQRLLIGREHQ